MKKSAAELTEELVAKGQECARLQSLLSNALRFVYLAGPALEPIIGGELGPVYPTADHLGVITSNSTVQVVIMPATETIVITGISTNHRLELVAPKGKLNGMQIMQIVATVAAIKAVRSKKADPLLDSVDLISAPVQAVEPALA